MAGQMFTISCPVQLNTARLVFESTSLVVVSNTDKEFNFIRLAVQSLQKRVNCYLYKYTTSSCFNFVLYSRLIRRQYVTQLNL